MALEHARPGQVIDIAPLGAVLRESTTHAIVKTSALELMRVEAPRATDGRTGDLTSRRRPEFDVDQPHRKAPISCIGDSGSPGVIRHA